MAGQGGQDAEHCDLIGVWKFHGIASQKLEYGAKILRELERIDMSQHTSLKSSRKIVTKRNVLKRFERIDLLRARGKWKEGNRGTGLPKTKPE